MAAPFTCRPRAGGRRVNSSDILIVGGGAAGMFAAAVIAEADPDRTVLVLEQGARPLAKVSRSGGGRCNLTHAAADLRAFARNYPRGGTELLGPLHRFGPAQTMAWFEDHAVPLKVEADGRVFPRSGQAGDVVRALLRATERGRVEIRTGAEARRIEEGPGFALTLADGRRAAGRKLLVATGGGRFPEGLGHAIEPCVPSLFTFRAPDPEFLSLAGVAVESVRVSAPGGAADGALLITHGGVSGPSVLRLSSFGARRLAAMNYRFEMKIDWSPGQRGDDTLRALEECRRASPRKQAGSGSPFGLPQRLWRLLLARAGVDAATVWRVVPSGVLPRIAAQVRGFALSVDGRDPHRDEFVTCGGVRLKDLDFRTLESRIRPGLHFAGEVLDIDALTGGFNLQAAWTTGYLAAQALLR
jgi:predicted Rossmann fold flavoprotein